jgi:hypothetical protein
MLSSVGCKSIKLLNLEVITHQLTFGGFTRFGARDAKPGARA